MSLIGIANSLKCLDTQNVGYNQTKMPSKQIYPNDDN